MTIDTVTSEEQLHFELQHSKVYEPHLVHLVLYNRHIVVLCCIRCKTIWMARSEPHLQIRALVEKYFRTELVPN